MAGAIRTIEEILLPELQTSWAKATAVQLTGLLRYAAAREKDDIQARQDDEVRACLADLAARFPGRAPGSPAADRSTLRRHAGELLALAQGTSDEFAEAIRAELRPLLARHTAEDLAEAGPLLQGFMTGFRGMAADAE